MVFGNLGELLFLFEFEDFFKEMIDCFEYCNLICFIDVFDEGGR